MNNDNLQKLIKQKIPFKNEYIKAEVGILYICNQLNAQFQQIMKEYGITSQQYNVLRILRGQNPNPANINLIRERMLDKMSDASRIVDRLVKLNYAYKQPNHIDKRNTDVYISSAALQLLAKLDAIIDERHTIIRNLQPNEIEQLNHLIDKILSD